MTGEIALPGVIPGQRVEGLKDVVLGKRVTIAKIDPKAPSAEVDAENAQHRLNPSRVMVATGTELRADNPNLIRLQTLGANTDFYPIGMPVQVNRTLEIHPEILRGRLRRLLARRGLIGTQMDRLLARSRLQVIIDDTRTPISVSVESTRRNRQPNSNRS